MCTQTVILIMIISTLLLPLLLAYSLSDQTCADTMTKEVAVRKAFFCSRGSNRNRARASIQEMKQMQMGGQRSYGLNTFRDMREKRQWGSVHSGHYDWWMFPIDDGSQSEYNVYADDVKELQADKDYIKNYREAVEIVFAAWGWDINASKKIDPPEQGMGWTSWDVRLAKICRSLWLFEQQDYLISAQKFARSIKPNGGFSYGRTSLDEILYMTLPRL